MLSDHEQRALNDLERCYVMEAHEPDRHEPDRSGRAARRSARRSNHPPGYRVLVVLACVSVALVLADVPTAGLALALATAIGWWFWRLWSHRKDDVSGSVPRSLRGRYGRDSSDRRLGESIRQYLAWLAEAE